MKIDFNATLDLDIETMNIKLSFGFRWDDIIISPSDHYMWNNLIKRFEIFDIYNIISKLKFEKNRPLFAIRLAKSYFNLSLIEAKRFIDELEGVETDIRKLAMIWWNTLEDNLNDNLSKYQLAYKYFDRHWMSLSGREIEMIYIANDIKKIT